MVWQGLIWQQSQLKGFYPAWQKAQRWTCTRTPEGHTHTHTHTLGVVAVKRSLLKCLLGLRRQNKIKKKGEERKKEPNTEEERPQDNVTVCCQEINCSHFLYYPQDFAAVYGSIGQCTDQWSSSDQCFTVQYYTGSSERTEADRNLGKEVKEVQRCCSCIENAKVQTKTAYCFRPFQQSTTVPQSASVNSNKIQFMQPLTHRSQAKEKQTKNETIKQQTSYLAIIEFILIIGCQQSGVILLILVQTVNT